MESTQQVQNAVRELLTSQFLAVLATRNGGQPYTNLVAFAATDDLKHLIFFTGRSTRKYANLKSDSRAAMLIDNRSNQVADIRHAIAATATGKTEEISNMMDDRLKKLYLAKHPHLEEFVESPSTALMTLNVEHYYVVSRFQNVRELHITP
jgi:nitroimidazol reductase NimA-like FMN-containing flavoprotein (pyridoxamine 5'-phosphate oxidase superfamily)